MKLQEYINTHRNKVVEIPTERIYITEKVHMNGIFTSCPNRHTDSLVIIVRKIVDDNYALVSGWRNFKEIQRRSLQVAKCIVVKSVCQKSHQLKLMG